MSNFRKTPYKVNVRDLLSRSGETRELDLEVKVPEQLGEGLVAVRADDFMDIDLRLESIHEGVLVTAHVEATASGECGRCLIDIELPVKVEIQELFAYSSDEAFEYEVQDDHVDLEPLIRDAVVLALPFQPVCRPDCPGLNPETGERLAEKPELTVEEPRDSRWAALADLQVSTDNDADGDAGIETKKER